MKYEISGAQGRIKRLVPQLFTANLKRKNTITMDNNSTREYIIKLMELSSQDLTLKQKICTLGKEIRDFQFSVLQKNPQAIIIDNEILNVKLPYDEWAEYFDKVKKFSEIVREIK